MLKRASGDLKIYDVLEGSSKEASDMFTMVKDNHDTRTIENCYRRSLAENLTPNEYQVELEALFGHRKDTEVQNLVAESVRKYASY